MYPELSEAERFPLLTEGGRRFLHAMRQHAHAPLWNWPNGEQLNEAGLARVQQFAHLLNSDHKPIGLANPDWLNEFVERCLETVPFYRSRSRPGTKFEDLPTCRRADLAPRVWQFVPDDESVDELISFSSSGTTGEPTRTPHHPYSAACGIPLLEYALQTQCGLRFLRGADQVAMVNVAAYPGAYTTAIVMAYLQESGCIRVNLDRSAWRTDEDCRRYLGAYPSPIWLGDPVAFGALERVDLGYAPAAIVSSIMHLHSGYAERLRSRYHCPVLDVYAMTEAGIIAVKDTGKNGAGHRVIAPDLYIEILDDFGRRCEPGGRGEITLTGGRNPYLPLLRYRTGDYAALEMDGSVRILRDLVGREPVEYIAESGESVHSMEIVRTLREFPVRRFAMREIADGYELEVVGDVDWGALELKMNALLGSRFRGLRPVDG